MNNIGAGPAIVTLLTLLGIAIIIFIILRALVLWYWKVDVIVKNQSEQIELMQEQNALLQKFIQAKHQVNKQGKHSRLPHSLIYQKCKGCCKGGVWRMKGIKLNLSPVCFDGISKKLIRKDFIYSVL